MKIQVLTILFLVGTFFTADLGADADMDYSGEMMAGGADLDLGEMEAGADLGADMDLEGGAALAAGGAGLAYGADGLALGAANIRTQRTNLAPRIMTQRVMAKPKVITERVVQPIYQRTVNKPSLLRERYVQTAQLNRQAPQVTNRQP